MPDSAQLASMIARMRALDAQQLAVIDSARDIVKAWEITPYNANNSLTDQQVHDAGFSTKSATQVQNLINAFAAFVALYDNTWGSVLEEMRPQ